MGNRGARHTGKNPGSLSALGPGSGHAGRDCSSLSCAAYPRGSSLRTPLRSCKLSTGCAARGLPPPHGEVRLLQARGVKFYTVQIQEGSGRALQAGGQQYGVLSGLKRDNRGSNRAPRTHAYPVMSLTPSPDTLHPWPQEAAPSLPVLCVRVLGGSAQEGTRRPTFPAVGFVVPAKGQLAPREAQHFGCYLCQQSRSSLPSVFSGQLLFKATFKPFAPIFCVSPQSPTVPI